MKRFLPFLVASSILVCVLIGMTSHFQKKILNLNDFTIEHYCYERGSIKEDNPLLLKTIVNKDYTILTLGSSELSATGESTHPGLFYQDHHHDMELNMLGSGSTQSLAHAINMGALGGHLKNNKVMIILSPQWFTKAHISANAFASVFRMEIFKEMLKNDRLPSELKEHIVSRTLQTLKPLPLYIEIKLLSDAYLASPKNYFARIYYSIRFWLNSLQRDMKISIFNDTMTADAASNIPAINIPFDKRMEIAESEGSAACTNNEFYVYDSYYNNFMIEKLEERKNSYQGENYTESVEYEDLKLLLNICQHFETEVLLVNVPVNGWWYDFEGFPREDRQLFYNNITEIAKDFQVHYLDLSHHEYTPYVLRDVMHLGWKGWVYIEEAIEDFFFSN